MLTIRAEIKKQEQKVDGTYNVKLRFTLNRKVKRLSTSLFVKGTDLTKSGNFRKGTAIYKEIDKLVYAYQEKCNSMQIDLNHYSLEDVFRELDYEEKKSQVIDFIDFSRKWIDTATIKGVKNYKSLINSLIAFVGKDKLNIFEITVPFLIKYGSSEIWSDFIVIKKKTAEQFVYLNNHKQMYKDEQQFSISCVGSL